MNCDDEINVAVFMKLENVRFALCKRLNVNIDSFYLK